ncbi:MAG: DEAD/DEAH box helicase [Candidatus Woesearchaeota archaeon]
MVTGLKLQPELMKAFEELGFSELTDIQKKTIPLILEGRDVIGQSQTGSGKTAAFGFPILEKISHQKGLQVLIVVPTRELCEQVAKEMVKFSKHKKMHVTTVYGGVSINPQIESLRHSDIVVATPGRLLDHLRRATIKLNTVKILVLDEADKMFEMGFIDDVKQIISQTPKERQTLLFSATISDQVHDIVRQHMRNPARVQVQSYVEKEKMRQYFYSVKSFDKFSLLVHILKENLGGLIIIFCATRRRVDVIARNLHKQGLHGEALHGGLSQSQRKKAIDMFHSNKIDILVASDVAARGLDIKNVTIIINYDLPKTAKEYIHRIGRTARAGKEGKVISLLSEQDHDNMRSILSDSSLAIEQLQLPVFQKVESLVQDRQGDRPFWQKRGERSNSSSSRYSRDSKGSRYGRSEQPRYGVHRKHYHIQRHSNSGSRQ